MKKVLLTGADGLLGSNLTRELLKRGYRVRAYVEYDRKVNTLDGLNVELTRGDILDADSIGRAIGGCNYVIHAASSVSQWPVRSRRVRDVNIRGTENIVNAAIEAGLERLIYIGSAACFFTGQKTNPADESVIARRDSFGTDYIDSKLEATKIVKNASGTGKLNSVILHPGFMIGPYDSGPGSGELLLAVARRKTPGYTRGGKNYIDVRDAAIATANALTMGRNGESYIIGNRDLSYREAFTLFADAASVKAPRIYFPPLFSLVFAGICTLISHITHKKPLVTIPMALASNNFCYVSSQKAVLELGLPQTDIRIAISDAIRWFRENGYL